MARKWSNQNLPGALHFVTGNVIKRIPVFSHDSCCHGFLDILADLRNQWPCKLIAYVLMLEHMHLILNPRDGDIKGFVGALKSRTATRLVDITADNRFVRECPDAATARYIKSGRKASKDYRFGVDG